MTPFRSAGAETNGFVPRAGYVPFAPGQAESTLAVRFREAAERHAGSVAYVDDDAAVTYGSLLDRAEAIAGRLQAECGEAGGTVAILSERAGNTLESILGALLGGFAYFCADPRAPASHVSHQLEAVAPIGILRDGGICETRPAAARLDGVAALYATSGSTGEPRIVALSHRAILFDIGRQTNDLYLGPDDRFDLLFSFAFSAALAPMFGALLNGAQVHLFDARDRLPDLPGWLSERRITVSTMSVSTLRTICRTSAPSACADLRLLSVGGERLLASDVAAFRAAFPPGCVLQNAMAATETRTYAQYFVPAGAAVEDPIPIGWPVAGKDVVLLGDDGEIAIRSRYLADGYTNDPDRTQERFLAQADGSVLYRTGDRGRFRDDGCLIFLGRCDSLVKIRGHRVELPEIEAALNRHPQILQSDVIVREDAAGGACLLACYATRDGAAIPEAELRRFLGAKLPAYMIPSAFAPLAEVPLNANGKLDRRRLSAGVVTQALPPARCRAIWEEVLGRTGIADDDNFFDLGGDSLSAALVVLEIRRRLRRDVAADAVYRHRTLAALARAVDSAPASQGDSGHLISFETSGRGWPIFFVHSITGLSQGYAGLARHLGAAHPCYGFNASIGDEAVPSVESMAAAYVREVRALVPPGMPVVVAGFSFGGTVAYEMARQLDKLGQTALPIVIDMAACVAPGSRARKLGNAVRNLPAWLIGEASRSQPKDLLRRAQGNLAKLCRTQGAMPDSRVYFGNRQLAGSSQSLFEAMYRALMAYEPQPYPGKVVLLRTTVPTLFRDRDRYMGWQAHAAGVEVKPIAGSHRQCLDKPNLPGLALTMERAIETAVRVHATPVAPLV